MNKKNLLITLIIFAILAIFSFQSYNKYQKENQFQCKDCNVIIIGYDAEQFKHLSYAGYPKLTSPIQDALAKDGVVFTNTISQASWTVPSFMSLFTSLYPSQHKLINKYAVFSKDQQIISDFTKISPDKKTLANIFKENGYVTGGFTGDAGVGAQFGYSKGFDVYIDSPTPFGGAETSIPPALKWLKANKDKKFFMFLHSYGIHGQYDPPQGFTKKFLDFDYEGPLQGGKAEQGKLREEGLAKGKLDLTENDWKFWRALYDEKIFDNDKKIGEFLAEIKKLGLDKNTIIISLSDHGTEFGEHNRMDHGFSLYNELIHVPLVIKFPNNIHKIIAQQVRIIDVMPTIIEAIGLKIDQKTNSQMEGKSLTPLMFEKETMGRNAFSETDYRNYTHKRSLQTADGWKFIYTFEDNLKELYNLKNDPGENNNLIEKEQKIAYEMEQKLFEYIKKTDQNIADLKNTGCLPVYGTICTEKVN